MRYLRWVQRVVSETNENFRYSRYNKAMAARSP